MIGENIIEHPETIIVDEHDNLFCGSTDGYLYRVPPGGKPEKWAYVGGHPTGIAFDKVWRARG